MWVGTGRCVIASPSVAMVMVLASPSGAVVAEGLLGLSAGSVSLAEEAFLLKEANSPPRDGLGVMVPEPPALPLPVMEPSELAAELAQLEVAVAILLDTRDVLPPCSADRAAAATPPGKGTLTMGIPHMAQAAGGRCAFSRRMTSSSMVLPPEKMGSMTRLPSRIAVLA